MLIIVNNVAFLNIWLSGSYLSWVRFAYHYNINTVTFIKVNIVTHMATNIWIFNIVIANLEEIRKKEGPLPSKVGTDFEKLGPLLVAYSDKFLLRQSWKVKTFSNRWKSKKKIPYPTKLTTLKVLCERVHKFNSFDQIMLEQR